VVSALLKSGDTYMKELKGRQIAVLATDGFEKVELTIPVKALTSAGADVDIISLHRGSILGVNLHEPANRVRVTKTLKEANPAEYDGLLIPGGFINPDLLRQSEAAREFVREFDRDGKPIASLCHGPWVLASAGLLEGRVLTSWPGVRDDLVNAGATWIDQKFVQDGNLVTSRGPQDLVPFVRGIKKHFALGASMTHHPQVSQSSPQAKEPPKLVIGAMQWLPKPSTRAAVVVGALAAGLFALSNRRASGDRARRLARQAA
jgi:protease I